MEYKKINEDEIEKLSIGTKINLGNGQIITIKEFGAGKYNYNFSEKMVICVNDKTGEKSEWNLHVLTQGTLDSMDETIKKCAYCYKLRPENETKLERIFINRGERMMRFCLIGPCAGYYQMGCER